MVETGGSVVHLVGYGDGADDLSAAAAVTVAMDTPYAAGQLDVAGAAGDVLVQRGGDGRAGRGAGRQGEADRPLAGRGDRPAPDRLRLSSPRRPLRAPVAAAGVSPFAVPRVAC